MPCLVMRKPKISEGHKKKQSMTECDDNMVEVDTSLLTNRERPIHQGEVCGAGQKIDNTIFYNY